LVGAAALYGTLEYVKAVSDIANIGLGRCAQVDRHPFEDILGKFFGPYGEAIGNTLDWAGQLASVVSAAYGAVGAGMEAAERGGPVALERAGEALAGILAEVAPRVVY
jgi:hypothetical protein